MYLKLLEDKGLILGKYDPDKVSRMSPQWFWDRQIDLLDFRGDLQIRCAETITFGRHVRILTASHDISAGHCGEMTLKKCWIDPHVFVGSYALLYNCHLQTGAVVACGAVVRNMTVPPYCMVEGNPARIIKRFVDGNWVLTNDSEFANI